MKVNEYNSSLKLKKNLIEIIIYLIIFNAMSSFMISVDIAFFVIQAKIQIVNILLQMLHCL